MLTHAISNDSTVLASSIIAHWTTGTFSSNCCVLPSTTPHHVSLARQQHVKSCKLSKSVAMSRLFRWKSDRLKTSLLVLGDLNVTSCDLWSFNNHMKTVSNSAYTVIHKSVHTSIKSHVSEVTLFDLARIFCYSTLQQRDHIKEMYMLLKY